MFHANVAMKFACNSREAIKPAFQRVSKVNISHSLEYFLTRQYADGFFMGENKMNEQIGIARMVGQLVAKTQNDERVHSGPPANYFCSRAYTDQ